MGTIYQIAMLVLDIMIWLIIARAILSWFVPMGRDAWSRILVDITEPLLAPVRALMGRLIPMIDLSPIVVILLINLLQRLLTEVYLRSR